MLPGRNFLCLPFRAKDGNRHPSNDQQGQESPCYPFVATLVAVGPPVFYYATLTVAIHGVIIFGIGRLARVDLPTLAIASQANVGGAASAIALASARGYHDRLVPGVAVGLLGYAVGNYIGIPVGMFMRGILG